MCVDHSYEGLIEDQPIGKSLFVEFCGTDVTLSKCHNFLTALDEFALVAEEKSAVTAQRIFHDFLSPEVSRCWNMGRKPLASGSHWLGLGMCRFVCRTRLGSDRTCVCVTS